MAAGAERPRISYQIIVSLDAPADLSAVEVLAIFEGHVREMWRWVMPVRDVVRISKVRVASMVFKGHDDEADLERGG